MTRVLLVVRPFDGYAVGDLIIARKDMRDVRSGAHAHDVIQVAAPVAVTDKREES